MPTEEKRPVADVILIYFTLTVCAILFISVVGIFIVEIFYDPSTDTSNVVGYVGNILSTLVVAIVGYLAGKRLSGRNGNGKQ